MNKKQKILNAVLIVLGTINLCIAWAAWSMSEPMPAKVRGADAAQRKLTERVDAITQWVMQVAPIQHTHTQPTNQAPSEVTSEQNQ